MLYNRLVGESDGGDLLPPEDFGKLKVGRYLPVRSDVPDCLRIELQCTRTHLLHPPPWPGHLSRTRTLAASTSPHTCCLPHHQPPCDAALGSGAGEAHGYEPAVRVVDHGGCARRRPRLLYGGAVQVHPIKHELKARLVSTLETKMW